MSNASVTATMRAHGWNVHFLASSAAFHFAGLFQPQGSDMVTFRDVLAEMRLCFDMPDAPDDQMAFFFAGYSDISSGSMGEHLSFISSARLDESVPAPPAAATTDSAIQPIVTYHLVRHTSAHCNSSSVTALASHLRAGCAKHISEPVRRYEPRYLPPKKPSRDPRLARLPLRRTVRARGGSRSPTKRSASGVAQSPGVAPTAADDIDNEVDVSGMVAPPGMDIAADLAQQTVAGFRSSCLVAARQCAVSGKGRSWCITPAVGPTVHACHIIPQQHYHLYPTAAGVDDAGAALDNGDDSDFGHTEPPDIEYSRRRLLAAWQRTWSPQNGILLLSHLHELFDLRLFSIHPDTLRIRVFVPYDVILDYHGRTAMVTSRVDRNALRHHYDMCCIENMAANLHLITTEPQLPPGFATATTSTGSVSSGMASPLGNRPRLFATPGPGRSAPNTVRSKNPETGGRQVQGESRDTGEKVQPDVRLGSHGEEGEEGVLRGERRMPPSLVDGQPSTTQSRSLALPRQKRLRRDDMKDGLDTDERNDDSKRDGLMDGNHGNKRRRLTQNPFANTGVTRGLDYQSDNESHDWLEDPSWDGCITPSNHKEFLADVDWELFKLVK